MCGSKVAIWGTVEAGPKTFEKDGEKLVALGVRINERGDIAYVGAVGANADSFGTFKPGHWISVEGVLMSIPELGLVIKAVSLRAA